VPLLRFCWLPSGCRRGAKEVVSDEPQQHFVPDFAGDVAHEDVVVDFVEEALHVDVYHPRLAFPYVALRLLDGLARAASGAEAVAVFAQIPAPRRG